MFCYLWIHVELKSEVLLWLLSAFNVSSLLEHRLALEHQTIVNNDVQLDTLTLVDYQGLRHTNLL